ncbi:TRAP transporter large permease [Thauera aminoaromatica]|mgnify:FL=1|jgi:C4-dicarboxylate transporter DctM subunit|uniref:TRAP transporter large permease protein n=2 Tax=Thauera aminoaromatica TaxID=164330 RepID=N6XQ35_THASP|nr:TRAP transporter large permease [Thauera aminoaromatica]MDA0234719.1 TRAP transporter large permease [Pseudomonadota bacterium]OPZ05719.1 MAG: Sialic acid TRAP transporter permease protein SiaT [Alphaproteobacteria bacterium ADurb.BinA305]ENO83801.1 TRAP dicarboxylate transporter subunit DctM [Thauera aminoaromatica S2]MCK6399986.1 TRAP transporter large permease [Thauera aminoaromatica]TXH84097.1 MAG: TRAP transporter large permease [Thauera aminoaromatica]
MISLILFGLFALLMIVGVPIGISLGIAAMAALGYGGVVDSSYLAQSLVTSIDSFPLMAVPFFILAGDLMGHGGISRRLLEVGEILFGRYTGGLGLVAVATCMFFAAISGSGPATVAAIGGILFPAMLQRGYDRNFSVGLVASAGCIGVVIPPSIPMVIYATSSGASVSSLFLAGVVPGVLIGVVLMLMSWFIARKAGYHGIERSYTGAEIFRILWDAKWALLVPVIILGGIYGGIFTPTEAAAVAVAYGFFVGVFVYKDLKLADVYKVLAHSALTSATVMVIVGTATVFGRVLAIEGIPVKLANEIVALTSDPIMILLLINVLFLVVGCFMETLAAIIILTPILLPVVLKVGVDPVHFGILMIVNLAIGMVTPPMGINLFVGSRVGNAQLEGVIRGATPFLLSMIVVLLVLTYVPQITLWLPNLMK